LWVGSPAVAAYVFGMGAVFLVSPIGPANSAFDYMADGTTLTGSTTGPDGSQVAIKNGKIDGANITFSVSIDFGGMPLEIGYKGVVSPAEIKMELDFMGTPLPVVVKKAP
jgi:hypothetical protein